MADYNKVLRERMERVLAAPQKAERGSNLKQIVKNTAVLNRRNSLINPKGNKNYGTKTIKIMG